jgi:cytidylate kinase
LRIDESKSISSIGIFKKYFDRHIEFSKTKPLRKTLEPFVTLSRQAGSDGILFGEMLIKYLAKFDNEAKSHWTLFDKDLMGKVAEDHNLPEDISKYMPERKMTELQDVLEKFYGLRPRRQSLIYKTSSTILHLAHLGNVVLVGRGAYIITKGLKSGLHIRLIASKEYRVKYIQKFYNISKIKALRFMEKEDKKRKDYVKRTYNKNIDDPKLYSIVFNMDMISYEDAASIIGNQVIRMRASK